MATGNSVRHARTEKSGRGSGSNGRQKAPRGAHGKVNEALLAKLQNKYSSGGKPAATTSEEAGDAAASQSGPIPKKKIESYTCLNPLCGKVFFPKDAYGTHGGGETATCCKACEDIVDPVSAAIRKQRSLRSF